MWTTVGTVAPCPLALPALGSCPTARTASPPPCRGYSCPQHCPLWSDLLPQVQTCISGHLLSGHVPWDVPRAPHIQHVPNWAPRGLAESVFLVPLTVHSAPASRRVWLGHSLPAGLQGLPGSVRTGSRGCQTVSSSVPRLPWWSFPSLAWPEFGLFLSHPCGCPLHRRCRPRSTHRGFPAVRDPGGRAVGHRALMQSPRSGGSGRVSGRPGPPPISDHWLPTLQGPV